MKKKVDDRIRTLIQNGVNTRHRSLFVIIGDKGRDQVVNLHYLLSKAAVKARPCVLWCYRDRLETGESGGLSYCLYRDTERILGSSYGMCVLQDFESLTPNVLARTIETVEGGGLVVMLLNTLSSLSKLCTMVKDVHERYRTKARSEIVSRFNERFMLSLASCKSCLVMDDELNILPLSSSMKSLASSSINEECNPRSGMEQELVILKQQLHNTLPIGPMVNLCSTLDQGKAVSVLLNTILDKTLATTIALVSPRGRGKSAALGIAIVGAIASGYSNIFVTAPTPENLKSLFEFVCRALSAQYEEHLHYNLVRSSGPESQKTIIKVNIHKPHRQTIQYIHPNEHPKLTQAELLVIDEAAAIPLPVIQSLLGPYMIFLSSTVNGYEGTGRSLSLNLLRHLEKISQIADGNDSSSHSGRKFCTLKLEEPIRYPFGDPLENWLNNLLCFDSSTSPIYRFPLPSECNLYHVNRDTLFSFHKESEIFLQRVMSIYAASHYKISPDDLQLMADASDHHLFVLLGPVDDSQNVLPDILCVIQVCIEGNISHNHALSCLRRGYLPHGNQFLQKFYEVSRDTDFSSLSVARVVRIAVHPGALREGYGSAALESLTRYYKGCLTMDLEDEFDNTTTSDDGPIIHARKVSIEEETIVPKKNLPPLLVPVCERAPERIDFIGASFGLTTELFGFWKKHKFLPFYVSQNPVFHIATTLAQKYFNGNNAAELSDIEASILLSIGLQFKDISSLEDSMKLESSQIKSKFYKLMKKFYEFSKEELMEKIGSSFPRSREVTMKPHDISVDDDLNDGAKEVYNKSKEDESVGWQGNESDDENFENHRYSSPSSSLGPKSASYDNDNSHQNSNPKMVFKRKRKDTCSSINSSMSERKQTSNSLNSSKRKRKHL